MNFEALKEQHGEDAVKEAFMLGVIQGLKQAKPINTSRMSEKMKNQPEEIFLNLGDDDEYQDWDELAVSEIGWSTEPCTTGVLRYVRADLQDKDVLTEAFNTWLEKEVKVLGAFKDEEAGKRLLLTAWLNGAFCGGVL